MPPLDPSRFTIPGPTGLDPAPLAYVPGAPGANAPGGLPGAPMGLRSPFGAPQGPMPKAMSLGTVSAQPLHVVMEEEQRKAQAVQAQPLTTALAGYVRRCFSDALLAKRQFVEPRMLDSVRTRRGVYDS